MSVMNSGEEVVYPTPGYPIYESQVDYLGGRGRPYAYVEEADGFRIDRASVEAALSDATRVLIVNGQHNPTGADASADEIAWLAGIARERDLCGAVRRAVLRHPLRRQQPQPGVRTGDGRAHRDRLHVLEDLRDDRLAPWRRDRPGPRHRSDHQAEHQPRVVHLRVHPARRRGGLAG
ncbi:Aspartate aminotransferase [Geodia barretti]|uniref:Aspartate aminotransferase n=1 Tax=Geodia barretti TaxID=519541 RepID=A0AA35RJV7_GEOBA|nr:Aspartate aminotransferase [Geodia barretti]